MRTDSLLDLDPTSREALEFGDLLEMIAGESRTAAGARAVLDLVPQADLGAIERETRRLGDVRSWYVREGALVPSGLPETAPVVARLAVAGALVEPGALRELCLSLTAVDRIVARFQRADTEAPSLVDLLASLTPLDEVTRPVLDSVDPEGRITDQASRKLAEIRTRRTRLAGRLRRRLETMLRDPGSVGTIQDEFVTQRNGRYVIPVRTDAPRPVRGIVHATSSSGATRFVEPLESVELNNELVELEEAEHEEEERLARAWADALRANLPEVEHALDRLARLDCLQARARYAERVGAVQASLEPGGSIRLRGLRHPLLERHLEETGGVCIPLDLELDPADRILVVSGPNTGGKTVALKSLGLAVLMAHSGIPVAAREAVLPLYRQVRSDVGDRQSIEADLSTFSGHVTAMASFLDVRSPPSLFLFDEIGSGTDPAEGAALAQAVLEGLAGEGVTVVATTHQNSLKHWAFGDDRAASAAMEFDERTLRPTYRILANVVGHSAALDIADRCGIPRELISRARELLGEDAGRSEAYVNRLRERLEELDGELLALEAQRSELAAAREKQSREAEREAEGRKKEAALFLDRELKAYRRQARKALERIEDTPTRKRTERIAHASERELKQVRERSLRAVSPETRRPELSRPRSLSEGMRVHVVSLDRTGVVRRIDGKRIEVTLGRIGLTVGEEDLRLPDTDGEAVPEPRVPRSPAVSSDAAAGPTLELMLVGRRVDEALDEVDAFLDRALLAAASEVRLIHGHGTGRLRRAVREHLKQHPQVLDYRAGGKGEGGDGATVARLA